MSPTYKYFRSARLAPGETTTSPKMKSSERSGSESDETTPTTKPKTKRSKKSNE